MKFAAELRETFAMEGIYAVIELLCGPEDPLIASHGLHNAMRLKYWKESVLPAALAFGRTGIHFCLQAAFGFEVGEPKLAFDLRAQAKGFAYDVASFAWEGWGQEGIEISPGDRAAGREADGLNLRLAGRLERGDLPLSRAHWMIAAYQLAGAELDGAAESFQTAQELAERAGE